MSDKDKRKAIRRYKNCLQLNSIIFSLPLLSCVSHLQIEPYSDIEIKTIIQLNKHKVAHIKKSSLANDDFCVCISKVHASTTKVIIEINIYPFLEIYKCASNSPSLAEYIDMIYLMTLKIPKSRLQQRAKSNIHKHGMVGIQDKSILKAIQSVFHSTGIEFIYVPPRSICYNYEFGQAEEDISKYKCGYICCVNTSGLKICSGCKTIKYCCKEHQRADWSNWHKHNCSIDEAIEIIDDQMKSYILEDEAEFVRQCLEVPAPQVDNDCRVPLRFEVGTQIECRRDEVMEEYFPGVVVAQHYRHLGDENVYPYEVRLRSGALILLETDEVNIIRKACIPKC